MSSGKSHDPVSDTSRLEKEILDQIAICRRCRMCVAMCPTHEGWLTQSAVGRLNAINLHFKYGLGTTEELSRLLYACTTCRRCQHRCKMLSAGVNPTDIIIKTRQLLVKKVQEGQEKRS
jgi:Fe-S oxidoreductase